MDSIITVKTAQRAAPVSYTHLDVYKRQVYDLVWNEPYSGDYNVVMRHICNIREKIEDDPGQPLYCLLYTSRCV